MDKMASEVLKRMENKLNKIRVSYEVEERSQDQTVRGRNGAAGNNKKPKYI